MPRRRAIWALVCPSATSGVIMNEIRWRKSTYSSSNGGNCVEVGCLAG